MTMKPIPRWKAGPANGDANADLSLRRHEFCALHRHCHLEPRRLDKGVLRRWQRRKSGCQRHGNCSRLDECRKLHFDGGHYRFRRLRRLSLFDGLDWRICPARTPACAVPAQIWPVYSARFHWHAVLLQGSTRGRRDLPYLHQLYLYRRPDAWRRNSV